MLEDGEIQMADEIERKCMYLSNLHGKRNNENNSEIIRRADDEDCACESGGRG